MDVQMPDMDGLETTSRIRRMEGEMTARPVYLVAMTASALAEDRLVALLLPRGFVPARDSGTPAQRLAATAGL